VIEFVLQSQDENNHPRSFVTEIEIIRGRAKNVFFTEREYEQSEFTR
jgi:hypothetical protein